MRNETKVTQLLEKTGQTLNTAIDNDDIAIYIYIYKHNLLLV